ncbi:flagellar hook-associated protein FlgL [Cellulomonas sp. P22]|uniref:flagellar hook-associated protein FlgL n=1 Tax=Cellulomonas sp. P22 TaxID=3373189 RepID=UPI0037A57F41
MSHLTIQQSTLANLQSNLTKMADLQAKMSGGKKVTVPSDDPAAASDMLRLRGEQRQQTQFARNADDGNAWLTTVDSALVTTLSTMRRARDLVVQGGNGSLGDVSREALAAELEGLRDTLMEQANTSYLGRSVFAGTSDAGVAFTSDYTFTGKVAGASTSVERRIGEATTVRVDSDGSAVFGEGDDSVFAMIDDIVTTLRSGGTTSSALNAFDTRFDAMLTEVASVGARHNQILTAKSTLQDGLLATKSTLSGIEDIDLAAIILDIKSQEVAYQGALGAASKVLQPSLMDYLR